MHRSKLSKVVSVVNCGDSFLYTTKERKDGELRSRMYNEASEELLSWENGELVSDPSQIRAYASMVVSEMPSKEIAAFVSFDGSKGIFIYADSSIEEVQCKE